MIRLDQRGHGESSHAPGTYVLDTYVSDTRLSGPLGCPAVVLRAAPALGPAFTTEDEERFLRTNPDARVVLVEGASHQIHDEQPARFLDELLTLLPSAPA